MCAYDVKDIPNEELRLEKLPPQNASWDCIQRFALTFDGYRYCGPFDRCAEIANARRHETVTDLRTCLYFEQRRWRHFGYAPEGDALRYLRYLVEQIRARVREADTGA